MQKSTETQEPPETVETSSDPVACDGGGGALGHPRVYLTLGEQGRVECPYCDRLYVRAGGEQGDGAGH